MRTEKQVGIENTPLSTAEPAAAPRLSFSFTRELRTRLLEETLRLTTAYCFLFYPFSDVLVKSDLFFDMCVWRIPCLDTRAWRVLILIFDFVRRFEVRSTYEHREHACRAHSRFLAVTSLWDSTAKKAVGARRKSIFGHWRPNLLQGTFVHFLWVLLGKYDALNCSN